MDMSIISLDTIYKILACTGSIITIIAFVKKILLPHPKRQLSNHSKFTDRYAQLTKLIELVKQDKKIINIYGKKGIGKSYFLKYFSDFVNGKISRKYIKSKKIYKKLSFSKRIKTKVIYYEINEYIKENDLITDFIENISNKESKNLDDSIKTILKSSICFKKIIIIFDNITNACMENSVENLILRIQPHSKKFVFVLGSIEELTLPKLGNDKPKIEILEFNNKEIKEYAKNCQKDLSMETIDKIYDVSNGLPIMVDLMITNDDFNDKGYYTQYIDTLFHNIQRENEILGLITIYIALLSLTNTEVSLNLLNNFDEKLNINKPLLNKLNMLAIIKYNDKKQTIKMHDIIRDYLVHEIATVEYYEAIKDILLFYLNNNNLHSGSAYAILLKTNDIDKYTELLIQCIKNSIENEEYIYLIALGNHYFRNCKNYFKNKLYYSMAYGYILSLLSVGDYPTAKMFSDDESLSIRDTIKNNQIDIAIQLADLYHLQSEYDMSIEFYNLILNSIDKNDNAKYIMMCNMKIAHSYRHIGKYNKAINYYLIAIQIAIQINDINVIATINLELSVIYMSNPRLFQLEKRYSSLQEMFEKTYKIILQTDNETSKLLYYRNYSRFLISNFDVHTLPIEAREGLNLALKGYESLKKRLIYTMDFEFGEYHRFKHELDEAVSYYQKAIVFSKKNGDKNLETMSYLGIILCEMDSNAYLFNKNQDSQVSLLLNIIVTAENHSLFVNKLLAQMLLTIIKGEVLSNEQIDYLEKNGLERTSRIIHNSNLKYNKLQLFMM